MSFKNEVVVTEVITICSSSDEEVDQAVSKRVQGNHVRKAPVTVNAGAFLKSKSDKLVVEHKSSNAALLAKKVPNSTFDVRSDKPKSNKSVLKPKSSGAALSLPVKKALISAIDVRSDKPKSDKSVYERKSSNSTLSLPDKKPSVSIINVPSGKSDKSVNEHRSSNSTLSLPDKKPSVSIINVPSGKSISDKSVNEHKSSNSTLSLPDKKPSVSIIKVPFSKPKLDNSANERKSSDSVLSLPNEKAPVSIINLPFKTESDDSVNEPKSSSSILSLPSRKAPVSIINLPIIKPDLFKSLNERKSSNSILSLPDKKPPAPVINVPLIKPKSDTSADKDKSSGSVLSLPSFNSSEVTITLLPSVKMTTGSEICEKSNVANGAKIPRDDLNHVNSRTNSVADPIHQVPVLKRRLSVAEDSRKKQKCEGDSDVNSRKAFEDFLDFIKPQMMGSEEEIRKIMKKLESGLASTDPRYIECAAFIRLINKTISLIKTDAGNVFVHVYDFLKELRFHKITNKKGGASGDLSCSSPRVAIGFLTSNPEISQQKVPASNGLSDSEDIKRQRLIKRAEVSLKRLRNKIEKLQSRELSLDDLDHDDSYYLREDRLKKRFVKVWNVLCKAKKCSNKAKREIYKKFRYSATKYSELNKRVENLMNKKRLFPDYTDIYNLVKSFSEETGLTMSQAQTEILAKDIFMDVGEELKSRRKREDEEVMHGYVLGAGASYTPPEDEDPELRRRLEQNDKVAGDKLQQVIDDFVEKQYSRNEEAVEVPDGEVDSPSSDENGEQDEGDDDDIQILSPLPGEQCNKAVVCEQR